MFSSLILCHAVVAFDPCRIEVIEEGSGWPVPLVELRTTHNVRFVTDNAGVVAFDLPELMGRETWFAIEGHGYEVPVDGFGFRGVRRIPKPGETLTIQVRRRLPAKRLGRITGAGIFGESQRFGQETDWTESGILGCDSVQTAVHRDRLFWFWGDTVLARYPLGLFHMTGANTERQPLRSFIPPMRIRYDYVTTATGVPREVGKIEGSGPTWINGTVSLPDKDDRQRLVGTYAKIEPPLTEYECGLCVWNDEQEQFERHRVLWTKTAESPKPPPRPGGHPVVHTDSDGKRSVYFGDPFPYLKCAADFESWSDPNRWEHLTPQPSVRVRGSDDTITPHRGCIAWNAYRKRWVAVLTEYLGEVSPLGEIWYTEADHPTGVWGPAVKVVTHKNYTFYNPCLHPEMTAAESPILLFEGTYTKQFANNPEATPRHEYNQILYRLDLDDATLVE
ncbi:MAG: hypothetical protein R3C05_06920 [Pirellulaceae bacterium]